MSTDTITRDTITRDTVPSPEPAAADVPRRSRRRTVKRALGGTALALTLAAGAGYLWLDATSDVHNVGRSDCTAVAPAFTRTAAGTATATDHLAVCGVLGSLTEAWGRGDAGAYGEHFTADATYSTDSSRTPGSPTPSSASASTAPTPPSSPAAATRTRARPRRRATCPRPRRTR